MFTATFDKNIKKPLYEQLYEHTKGLIASGTIKDGEKLPSRRKIAAHLQVSVSTVENAYAQLQAEGYIESAAKKGYYARRGEADGFHAPRAKAAPAAPVSPAPTEKCLYDLKTNAVDTDGFPFSIWTKLMRQSLREEKDSLLDPGHPQGSLSLRAEIARYLDSFRGVTVSPEQIVLGAGTEYLLGLVTELLRGQEFAVENPCYNKQLRILRSRRVKFHNIPMDGDGISVESLEDSAASVAIITPSRHFPLGTVTSACRRSALLRWAASGERYLIEDDFDSEFRYLLKQIPAIYSLDSHGKVIYMNTFARTLAPSLRIGYMALPPSLLPRYREKLGFYSCTVSAFEQSALRRFLRGGYYERHLHRMKQVYKNRRDSFLRALSPRSAGLAVSGGDGGLHLLISSRRGLTESQLVKKAADAGVKVYGLSRYYAAATPDTGTVVAGYGGLGAGGLERAAALLRLAWA